MLTSSYWRCFVKKGKIKNLANFKFHRKTPVFESLFNKVVGLQACNFLEKRLQQRYFPEKYAKFLRTPILKNICKRLLLNVENFKQLSKENAAKLFKDFKIKNATTDKYSFIYVLYYKEIISSLFF